MPMSPAQAAQLLKISRRTVMRAIETHEIKAFRDNKNHWKIDDEELDRWAKSRDVLTQPTEHAHPQAPTSPTEDAHLSAIKLAEAMARIEGLETMLSREREALEEMRKDRDEWRSQASSLLKETQNRKRWWKW